jgi:hypothetical protein
MLSKKITMSQITHDLISGKVGNPPLSTYPWEKEAEKLILWAKNKTLTHRAFIFDLLMSLAYVDTIPNIQKNIKRYQNLHDGFNAHLGFINLCVPCLLNNNEWRYQKAAKPQSGAIGKLTSEIILKCVNLYFDEFTEVKSIGGVGLADAVLIHKNGTIILCEIKASPLTTFPFLFDIPETLGDPETLTRSQILSLESALYLHGKVVIPLGSPKDELWPFRQTADYITSSIQNCNVEAMIAKWDEIRKAYRTRDKSSVLYYIANASGHPPKIAKNQFDWPTNESISDSKTSAGLDRTDDIKKGIYQTFKLSIESAKEFPSHNIKTALISNLPAYRHGVDYIEPFYDIYWGQESSFVDEKQGSYSCKRSALKRPFDYIIALDDAFTRGDLL